MKIITKINSSQNFKELMKLSSSIILGTQYSLRPAKVFSIEDIKNLVIEKNDCKIFVELDKIFHEGEVEQLSDFIKELIVLDIDGIIYSDLAVLNIITDLKSNIELVYDPVTYLTSSKQINFYQNYGVKGFVLSRELTIQEIKKIFINSNTDNIWVQGYGLTQMLHSKRNLINNFENFEKNNFGKKLNLDKENIQLYDEERNQSYPIFEYKDETFIMSPKTLNAFSEIKKLKKYGVNNLIVDFTLQENNQIKILENINNYILNQDNEYLEYIDKNSKNGTSLGLLYKKTMYKI